MHTTIPHTPTASTLFPGPSPSVQSLVNPSTNSFGDRHGLGAIVHPTSANHYIHGKIETGRKLNSIVKLVKTAKYQRHPLPSSNQ